MSEKEKKLFALLREKAQIAASWARVAAEHCKAMNEANKELDRCQNEIIALGEQLEKIQGE